MLLEKQQEFLPASMLEDWFSDALRKDEIARFMPSLAVCAKLARRFQISVNQHNNAELERRGTVDRSLLMDVSLAGEIEKKRAKWRDAVIQLKTAARQVTTAARELEDFGCACDSTDVANQLASRIIFEISVPQTARSAPARGRRREIWHAAAREIAHLIKSTMQDVGYEGRLNIDDRESIVAIVGAKVVSRAYVKKIKPSGFATAMRSRDRRRNSAKTEKTFDERYPNAKRILDIQGDPIIDGGDN